MDSEEIVLMEEEEAPGPLSRSNWVGSDADIQDMIWLVKSHRIAKGTRCRPPGKDVQPNLKAGELVVFLSHFERGFGLPLSDFGVEFFDHFDLQPHHLTANAILILSCFVTFCEAYLGVWPSLEIFKLFFQFRKQTYPAPGKPASDKITTEVGGCTIMPRANSDFPRIPCLESAKMWNKTFFYIESSPGAGDQIGLPPFIMGPPTSMTNWKSKSKRSGAEVKLVLDRLGDLLAMGFTADHLIATFLDRRVSPLQKRPHKICHMSGRFDPCRHSTILLSKEEVQLRAKAISQTLLQDNWAFVAEPYSRDRPPPQVFFDYRHC
jgi:hypothetical protein